MAEFLKRLKRLRTSVPGQVAEAVVYATMLVLVLAFFTGNGQFIYEAF